MFISVRQNILYHYKLWKHSMKLSVIEPIKYGRNSQMFGGSKLKLNIVGAISNYYV